MKKLTYMEIIALIIVGVLMIATVVGGGYFIVNNVKEANKKLDSTGIEKVEDGTIPTTESVTQQEGEEVTVENKDNSKNEEDTQINNDNNAEKTETNTQSDNSDKTQKKDNKKNSKKNNKKNNKNNKEDETTSTKKPESNNNDGDGVQIIVPETNATHSSKKALKVNGVDCYVGDTITITMNMKTPEVLMNFQGYTKYDDKYLKLESIQGNVNGMFNDHESCIYYNGSDISKGFDFTEKGTMYTATFKVLKEGTTGVVNKIEVMTDKNDKIVNPKDVVISIGVFD